AFPVNRPKAQVVAQELSQEANDECALARAGGSEQEHVPEQVVAMDRERVRWQSGIRDRPDGVLATANHFGAWWFEHDFLIADRDAQTLDCENREDLLDCLLVVGLAELVRDP